MARIGLLEWFRDMTRPGNYGFGNAIGSKPGDIVNRFLPALRAALWEAPIASAYPDMMILGYLERRDSRLRALAPVSTWRHNPRKLARHRFRLETDDVSLVVVPQLIRNGFQVTTKVEGRKFRAFVTTNEAARWAHIQDRHLNETRSESLMGFRLARGAAVSALRGVFARLGEHVDDALPLLPSAKLPPYAWPGGYLLVYCIGDEYDAHCAECAGRKDPRALKGVDVYYEGPTERCAECDREMPSEYGDPSEDKEETAEAVEESGA